MSRAPAHSHGFAKHAALARAEEKICRADGAEALGADQRAGSAGRGAGCTSRVLALGHDERLGERTIGPTRHRPHPTDRKGGESFAACAGPTAPADQPFAADAAESRSRPARSFWTYYTVLHATGTFPCRRWLSALDHRPARAICCS